MVNTLNTPDNSLMNKHHKDKRKSLRRDVIVYTTGKSKFPVLTTIFKIGR